MPPSKSARQFVHDIRSPLSALKIAQARVARTEFETAKLIAAAIERIENLVNGIAGGAEPIPQAAPVPVENLRWAVGQIFDEKRTAFSTIDFFISEFPFAAAAVNCDVEKLKTVLSNLIDNAIEALKDKPDGRVHLTLAPNSQNSQLLLRIEDNGCGIPATILPYLGHFGISYGKEDSVTGHRGLGLADARKTLSKWGGALEIESLPDLGTAVLLRLQTS